MAEGVVIEFDGVGRELYDAVNATLGIDMASGSGDWPEGLQMHAGGTTEGGFAVIEVWASRGAQQQFMDGRLGEALQAAGAPAPSRITWLSLVAHHILAG